MNSGGWQFNCGGTDCSIKIRQYSSCDFNSQTTFYDLVNIGGFCQYNSYPGMNSYAFCNKSVEIENFWTDNECSFDQTPYWHIVTNIGCNTKTNQYNQMITCNNMATN